MVPFGLHGQVVVSADRDLDFGVVFGGVPSTVDPTDAVKSGRIVVTTPRNVQFRVSFSVPSTLQGPGAASMPITIGNGDITARFNTSSFRYSLNPSSMYIVTMGRGYITFEYGGTVNPTASQAAGAYAGPIIMTVSVL
jgi:hypothetical protein